MLVLISRFTFDNNNNSHLGKLIVWKTPNYRATKLEGARRSRSKVAPNFRPWKYNENYIITGAPGSVLVVVRWVVWTHFASFQVECFCMLHVSRFQQNGSRAAARKSRNMATGCPWTRALGSRFHGVTGWRTKVCSFAKL